MKERNGIIMVIYEIFWIYNDFENILREGFNEEFCWYMILLRKKGLVFKDAVFGDPELVYIGKAVKQAVSDRLLRGHDQLIMYLRDFDRKIMMAVGKPENPRTLSEEEIGNIESALIAKFKPRLNAHGLKEYKGPRIIIRSRSNLLGECHDIFIWEWSS